MITPTLPTTLVVAEPAAAGPRLGGFRGPVIWIVGHDREAPDRLHARVVRRLTALLVSGDSLGAGWFAVGRSTDRVAHEARKAITGTMLRALACAGGGRLDILFEEAGHDPKPWHWELATLVGDGALDPRVAVHLHFGNGSIVAPAGHRVAKRPSFASAHLV